ncbi:MAG: YIP1 family protein [Halobellus sp.]|uniref:YIP1 family protein n=1 Tax=Halobellus sp. TaxID=1979212 RepID=UPI0035D510CD
MVPPLAPLSPKRYFRERDASANRALAVVALSALVASLAMLPVGWLLATSFDSSTTVPNPDHPEGSLCESRDYPNLSVDGETVTFGTPEDCAEPARIGVRSVVWRVVAMEALGRGIALCLAWVGITAALYALARHSFETGREAIAIAGWGTVPWAASALVVAGVLVATVDPSALRAAGGSASATADALAAQLRAALPMTLVPPALATVWTGWIHYHGLRELTALSSRRALELAGVVNASGYLLVLTQTLLSV